MKNLLRSSIALALLCAACGGLSNEDLQFMAVLPDQNLTVALPEVSGPTMVDGTDPATVMDAVDAATRFNNFAHLVGRDARTIVSRAPSIRRKGHREWGPYVLPGGNGFYELIMDKSASVSCEDPDEQLESSSAGYTFTVQVSLRRSGSYQPVVSGSVSGLDFGHSCGTMTFHANVNRQFGGGETDNDPNTLTLAWTRGTAATRIIINVDASPSGNGTLVENTTYEYRHVASGYGHFDYAERYHPVAAPLTTHVLVAHAAWGPNGKPWRVDAEVDDNSGEHAELSHGVACGPAFGEISFHDFNEPPATTIDTSDDANCSFDYSASN